jgi:hypothetical protein
MPRLEEGARGNGTEVNAIASAKMGPSCFHYGQQRNLVTDLEKVFLEAFMSSRGTMSIKKSNKSVLPTAMAMSLR